MKLNVPKPLLTQPVETSSSPSQPEGLPLDDKRLDPILEQAVESQPEVRQPEPPPAPEPTPNLQEEKPQPKRTETAKPLSLLMLGLAVAGAVVAIASQGAYGSQPATLRVQPSAAPQAGASSGNDQVFTPLEGSLAGLSLSPCPPSRPSSLLRGRRSSTARPWRWPWACAFRRRRRPRPL